MMAMRLARVTRTRFAAPAALAALALLLLFGLRSPPAFYLSLVIGLAAFLAEGRERIARFLSFPAVWFALILWAAVLLRGWFDPAVVAGSGDGEALDSVWHHARYSLLIPLLFGWLLCEQWRWRGPFVLILIAGAFIYFKAEWGMIAQRAAGTIGPVQELGATASVMFFIAIGVIAWCREHWADGGARKRWSVLVIGGALMGSSAVCLVLSASRSAWLVTLAGLGVLAVILWRWQRTEGTARRTSSPSVLAAGLLFLIVIVILFRDAVMDRLLADADVVAALVDGRFDSEIGGSWAIRLRMILQGGADIAAHPLLGIGPASVRDALQQIWGQEGWGYGNYHNTYINLAVAMGLPWAILWILAHSWVVWRGLGWVIVVDRELALALGIAGALLSHFGDLLFEVRFWNSTGAALYVIVMTFTCATYFRSARSRASALRDAAEVTSTVDGDTGRLRMGSDE
ncbi:O-antigen ligase family protein [Halofilum ochraceum]|uniref:O-antigen ligase family protein n=1 Tax=Halofilum ochraceum TaxID=1611323 RepID=UPI00082FFB39|nr:O-antigen ligase family protein [Halofilum ochraceum]